MLPDSAAIEPLLAERDAIHGWLQRLDQTGSGTPESVRAKVRSDYERRLEGITDRLRDHADTIASRLAEDQAEHADLMTQKAVAEVGMAEAELRHAVGEYDSGKFASEQARYSEEILRCRQGLDAAAERIDRMESVHALVTQPVVSVESLAPTPVVTSTANPVVVDVAPMPHEVVEERFDDAMLSVFDEPKDRNEVAPGLAPLSFRPGSGMAQDHTRTTESRRFSPSSDTPALGLPQDALPRFSRQPDAPMANQAQAASVNTTAESPAQEEDELFGGDTIVAASGAEASVPASRTLRCGECGAMNKPLEWYCEKCGAELTAA